MAQSQSQQPAASPAMTPASNAEPVKTGTETHAAAPPPKKEGILETAGEKYLDSAMDEAGKDTATYIAQNGQQDFEDAKGVVQGWWAKLCGCLS